MHGLPYLDVSLSGSLAAGYELYAWPVENPQAELCGLSETTSTNPPNSSNSVEMDKKGEPSVSNWVLNLFWRKYAM